MTLKEVLKKFNNKNFDMIEYRGRTHVDGKEKEYLVGFASYKDKMLISLDGDNYHLDDKISKYELYKDNWLVVWYE